MSVYQHVDISFAKLGETKMKQSHKSVDKLEFSLSQDVRLTILNVTSGEIDKCFEVLIS